MALEHRSRGMAMKKKITRRDFLKTSSLLTAAVGLGGYGLLLKGCTTQQDYDVIIKNGFVLDGLGNETSVADIGLQGEIIQKIGKISSTQGKAIIDATGLSVCPGFIDAHDHTDIELLVNPRGESAIRQGITTVVSGNCGSSPFPIAEEISEELEESYRSKGIELTWRDINGFFSRLEEKGMSLNYSTLVGHGRIRGASMGLYDRPPKQEELEKMKMMVAENMKNGALGLSTGLEYSPGCYAQNDEIVELCRIVSQFGGVYATHMRDEGDRMIESLEESFEAARRTGVSLQISHFKIAYPRNWYKIDDALKKVEDAKKEGISVFCDRYPYIAGSTGLDSRFPLWARQGTNAEFLAGLKNPALEGKLRDHLKEEEERLGSWDKVVISSVITEKNRICEGKNILECAMDRGTDPYTFIRDLLLEENNEVDAIYFMMKEGNLRRILSHPQVGVGCDGSAKAPYGPLGTGKPHPRSYGTFPRILGKYVREEKIVPLHEMIKKMTSVPAQKFGFDRRGVLKEGHFADIVIFDEEKVIDRATWENPHQYPEGIEYVLVNGKPVIKEGEHTGSLPGKILKKKVKEKA
jgi:N-acyl-D-amino-acid deacylase